MITVMEFKVIFKTILIHLTVKVCDQSFTHGNISTKRNFSKSMLGNCENGLATASHSGPDLLQESDFKFTSSIR